MKADGQYNANDDNNLDVKCKNIFHWKHTYEQEEQCTVQ